MKNNIIKGLVIIFALVVILSMVAGYNFFS